MREIGASVVATRYPCDRLWRRAAESAAFMILGQFHLEAK